MPLTKLRAFSDKCVNPFDSGTPGFGVSHGYDCALRTHVWQFAKTTLPERGSFKTVFDSLQLQVI